MGHRCTQIKAKAKLIAFSPICVHLCSSVANSFSPVVEDEEDGERDEGESDVVVPFNGFVQVELGEDDEDDEGDGLLGDLEVRGGEAGIVADAIGGDLEAVFDGGDEPAYEDRQP